MTDRVQPQGPWVREWRQAAVITAAAAIMILIFASFALGDSVVIKQFGIGLAGAVLIDAFIVRTVLVPSLMHVFGKANWWLPTWLDRGLPHLNVEGANRAVPSLAFDELDLELELAEPAPLPEPR